MTKKAILLMGLPLSGKSTWIKFNVDKLVGMTLVSADAIKEAHPDYDPNRAFLLHDYSVKEAENQIDQLSQLGSSMVIDSGSINNSYTLRIIKLLQDRGYFIKLVHIKTPYTVCLERNKSRERKVPEAEIIKKAIRENAQFHKLDAEVDDFLIVEYFTNKHIFVDMDGVIAALGTLPIINGEIDFVNGEVHKYLEPVSPIISKLAGLPLRGYTLYILSAVPNSFSIDEKNEWLDKHFNIVPKERRFYVNQGKHKAEMLDNLCTKLKLKKTDVMMLDDMHDTLYQIKSRGMNAMHVSEFLIHNFKTI